MSEKIIDRIRKMLALANDLAATEHERDTALNMAYKTMTKYNIDMATVGQKETQEVRDSYEYHGFSFPFAKDIAYTVADLFFCFYLSSYKINGTQMVHRFIGKESNAATAMVMTDFIIKSVMKEGRKLYKQNTSPECRSFCLGAARRLSQRVKELKAEAMNQQTNMSTALVVVSMYESELFDNEQMAKQKHDYKIVKHRQSKVQLDAYRKGDEFGKSINLSLQVGGTSNNHKQIGN